MSTGPLYHVPVGSRLDIDGRGWLVTGLEEHGYAVEGVEDGECATLSFIRVDDAIKDRRCDVTKPADAEKRAALLKYTEGIELVEQLPSEQQDSIRCRLAIVLAMDALDDEGVKLTQQNISTGGFYRRRMLNRANSFHQDGSFSGSDRGGRVRLSFQVPQGRTLKRYQKIYHEFGQNPVVLMDRDHMKGHRRSRLSELQKTFVDHAIALWNKGRQPKLAPLLRLAMAAFHVPPKDRAAGFCFPSITTIRSHIKAISQFVKEAGRNGFRHARNRLAAGTSDVRALYFGEYVEVDQVYLSLFTCADGTVRAKVIDPAKVKPELEDNEIRRLWLHVMIDVATRLPLAWIIAESSDADHTHALLRMATRDKSREKIRYECKRDPAPAVRLQNFVADNGTATTNGSAYASLLGFGSTVSPGRTYHAPDKPHVETLFGTVQWQVLNFLPGYTASRPGELKDYDPKGSAEITHDHVYGTLTRYFVDEYAHSDHRGTAMFGATPWEKLQESISTYRAIDAPSQRERCIHLGVKVDASTTPEGVKAFNIPYNSTALQTFAGGTSRKVVIHMDPDDLRRAYVTAEGYAKVIEINLSMTVFSDLTLEEAIAVMEDACKRNPKAQELHDAHLREVRARRARESGFFPDTRDPSNFQTIEKLTRRTDRLAQVSFRPAGVAGLTARPGSVTDRNGGASEFSVRKGTSAPALDPPTKGKPPRPTGRTFSPIKDSKI